MYAMYSAGNVPADLWHTRITTQLVILVESLCSGVVSCGDHPG